MTMASDFFLKNNSRIIYEDYQERADDVWQNGFLFRGVVGRDLILCLVTSDRSGMFAYINTVYGDAVPVFLSSTAPVSQLKKILQSYSPNYIWVQTSRKQDFDAYESVLEVADYSLLHRTAPEQKNIFEELALLATTSGSTGNPKFVRQTHRNVIENTKSIIHSIDLQKTDTAITSLPITYTFGMSIINCQLSVGADLVVTPEPFTQSTYWKMVEEHSVKVFAGVPYSYELLNKFRILKSGKVNTIEKFLQAGGRLKEALQVEISEAIKGQNKKFFIMYGQAEATTRISCLPHEQFGSKIGSVGQALLNGEIAIENDGKKCAPLVEGDIIYRGPNVALGYSLREEDLLLGDQWQGTLWTGDVGYHDEDGYVFITGRKKRISKINGISINLDHLEKLLAESLGVELASVEHDDRIHIFIEQDIENDALASEIERLTAIDVRFVEYVNVKKIERLESGKINYKALAGTLT